LWDIVDWSVVEGRYKWRAEARIWRPNR
jgi:superoxide dismutase